MEENLVECAWRQVDERDWRQNISKTILEEDVLDMVFETLVENEMVRDIMEDDMVDLELEQIMVYQDPTNETRKAKKTAKKPTKQWWLIAVTR